MPGYIEIGNHICETPSWPDTTFHYRLIEAETPEELNRVMEEFKARVVAAGASVHLTTLMSDTEWLYLVVFYHPADLEIFV